MKLNVFPGRVHPRGRRSGGFTMVEIALCLAIIGFALVAIIGVLPSGLSVQKDNREQTVINLDAAFLMDTLRSGAQGQNDLTNYVQGITIVSTLYNSVGFIVPGTSVTTSYTNGGTVNWTFPNPVSVPWNGNYIVGLLTTPKYVPVYGPQTIGWGYYSNTVTAVMRAINGPVSDQMIPPPSRPDFAFNYQVQVEVIPSAEYAYSWNPVGLKRNVTASGLLPSISPPLPPNVTMAEMSQAVQAALAQGNIALAQALQNVQAALVLQNNLNEVRLSYKWPILPGGGNKFGGGRQVFRSSVAGMMSNNIAVTPNLYFIQPLTYQSTNQSTTP